MMRYLRAQWPYLVGGFIITALAASLMDVALDAASRPRPAKPLPRKLLCVEVKDPGTGTTWTCAEKRP